MAGCQESLQALSLCCPSGRLFPTLQTMVWRGRQHPFPTHAFFLATLTHLTVFDWEATNTSLSLLSTLATSCPRLRHVSLFCPHSSERGKTANSLFLGQLQSVQSLVIHAPAIAVLNQIAHLPQLTALELGGQSFQREAIEAMDSPIFRHLRLLDLGAIDTRSATNLLRCLSRTSIVFLQMTLTTHPAMSGLFEPLQSTNSHASLDSLRITAFDDADATDASERDCPISGRSLTPSFSNMTTLLMESIMGFDLDDLTVARLASAWPRIQRLTLRQYYDVPTVQAPTELTMKCLEAFARHCPVLQFLAVSFHATSVPSQSGDEW
ncbi:hypothetical protein C8R47DRAFT_1064294 [Mycena vitilis]|nr:hypothetical protein C8R47DRAFT_1064294 [Mycena vitilis]